MRTIKFKAFHKERNQMYWFDILWGNFNRGGGYTGMVEWGKTRESNFSFNGNQILVDPNECELMQYTDLKDSQGTEIHEGDIVKIKWVQDHWQTHTGDNIPGGSYTEPDESTIEEQAYSIVFKDGGFCLDDSEMELPIDFPEGKFVSYYLDSDWNEQNLQYLDNSYFKDERYNSLNDLRKEIGLTVIGNIYQHPELLPNGKEEAK